MINGRGYALSTYTVARSRHMSQFPARRGNLSPTRHIHRTCMRSWDRPPRTPNSGPQKPSGIAVQHERAPRSCQKRPMFAPDLPGSGAFPPVSVGGGTGLPPLPPYYPALLPPMPFKPPFLPMTPSMAPLTLHLSHNSAFKPNMAILGGDLRRPLADAGLRRSPSPPDFKPPAADRLEAKFAPRARSPDFKAAVDERAAAKPPIAERLELKPPPAAAAANGRRDGGAAAGQ
nr:uncharacterized protein LOC113826486 [Penaeus vannamei]